MLSSELEKRPLNKRDPNLCEALEGRAMSSSKLVTIFYPKIFLEYNKYQLDTETRGSTVFINPRAQGCSHRDVARALLMNQGFINTVDPVGMRTPLETLKTLEMFPLKHET